MKAQASVWFSRLVMGLALTACFSSSRGLAQKLVGPLPPARGDVVEPSIAKCDKDAADYYNTAYMSARDSVTRSQIETLDYPEIVATQKRKLKACVQKLDARTFAGENLLQLVRKYVEVGDHDAESAAFNRYMSAPGMTDSTRVRALLAMVEYYASSPTAPLQHSETYSDQLDAAPNVAFRMKHRAHEMLFSRYQQSDIDLGSQKHALAVIKLARNVKAQVRSQAHPDIAPDGIDAAELMTMYQTAANVDGNFGRELSALTLLEEARRDHPEISAALLDSAFRSTVSRLKLTGQQASAVESEHWFSAPDGMRSAKFAGNVTVLGFTAHWCPPCKKSYVPLAAMSDSLSALGARFMFVTTYYGFVGSKRNLTADQERDATRLYYQNRKITFPVAMLGDGYDSVKFERGEMPPAFGAYFLEQIPQSVIIDRHGKIRRIILGWDAANSERIPALVNALLREK